jgi:hypothetical protein
VTDKDIRLPHLAMLDRDDDAVLELERGHVVVVAVELQMHRGPVRRGHQRAGVVLAASREAGDMPRDVVARLWAGDGQAGVGAEQVDELAGDLCTTRELEYGRRAAPFWAGAPFWTSSQSSASYTMAKLWSAVFLEPWSTR